MDMDVAVAGGGPVGLYLARLLQEKGLEACLLEEHGEIGNPNHCSGLISRNLDRFIKPGDWVEHKVSGAVFKCGPAELKVSKPGIAAYVIDRSAFDSSLAEGLDCIRFHMRLEGFSVSGNGVSARTNKGTLKANMIIGCDGANSVVARHFGFRPKKLLQGAIAITGGRDFSQDVEIHIEKKLAPDGFFWRIPRGETTEYGMFCSGANFQTLENFFKLKKPYERRAGLIPMGPGKTHFERALLVGDAAGMTKPWSGGGVIWGFTAARVAARAIEQACEQEDFSEAFLARYEKGWKRAFGRQVQVGMLGRKIFERMENPEICLALRGLGILRPLVNRMDMDFLAR